MAFKALTQRFVDLQKRREEVTAQTYAAMMDATSSVVLAAVGKAMRPAVRGFFEQVLLEARVADLQPWLQKLPTDWLVTTEKILDVKDFQLVPLNPAPLMHVRLHGGFPPTEPSEAAWQNFLQVYTELTGQTFTPPYARTVSMWQRYVIASAGLVAAVATVVVLGRGRNV